MILKRMFCDPEIQEPRERKRKRGMRENRATAVMTIVLALWAGVLLCGCGCTPSGSRDGTFQPLNPEFAVFWDRQTTESAELLRDLVEAFNRDWKGMPVKVERSGSYTDIFRKVTAGINAGVLPAMAVSYESMTIEYIPLGAVRKLDDLITGPETGLSQEALDDFFPAVLEQNRFPEHGNSFYSFPFAKSILMMYFNKKVLAEAGIAEPPETWTEFIDQCRLVKRKTGKYAHAVHADCSTVNGMIYSMGGEVVQGRKTLYDSEEALSVFRIYETLAREELAYLIAPGTYEDNIALSKNDLAFVLRTSSALSDMMMLMEDDRDRWGLTRIPQTDPEHPATVLFGPNVCLFNTGEEQVKASWAFVKYFTNPEVSVRWALATGYLPVRKSAHEHPDMRAYWEQWRYNRAPYDCLSFARPEPNIAGWQQVRDIVARGVTEIMTGVRDADSAAREVQRSASEALAHAGQHP